MKFLWACTFVAAAFAGVAFVGLVMGAKGAPQEAAGAAMALCVAVIPYVFTRAVEGMATATWRERMLSEAMRRNESATPTPPGAKW